MLLFVNASEVTEDHGMQVITSCNTHQIITYNTLTTISYPQQNVYNVILTIDFVQYHTHNTLSTMSYSL